MTYYTLQQMTTDSPISKEYIPTGSDEDEYRKWAIANGQPVDEEDFVDDLIELGLG